MTSKEALRDYIDSLSEDEAGWLLDRLRWEEAERAAPLTEAERAMVERGLEDLRQGRRIPHEEMRRRLGL